MEPLESIFIEEQSKQDSKEKVMNPFAVLNQKNQSSQTEALNGSGEINQSQTAKSTDTSKQPDSKDIRSGCSARCFWCQAADFTLGSNARTCKKSHTPNPESERSSWQRMPERERLSGQ